MKNIHDVLFTPFRIGEVEIKNRIVMTAMTGTALVNKGKFNKSVTDYYLERARGGVGLIVSGCSVVYDMFGRDYWVNDAKEAFQGPIRNLMNELHREDCKFFMQIGAGLGRVANLETGSNFPGADVSKVQFASSRLPNVWNKDRIHREMTIEEIHRIQEAMIKTAVLAKEAGVDGVEIHVVHEGYLLDQFAIQNMNSRTDEYGGSLENRLRFAVEIIKGIKQACGKDYPVMMRYGVVSKMKGFNSGALPGEAYREFGRSEEESPAVAKMLEEAGVDALDADNGSYDSWYWAHPPVYMHEGCNLPEAHFIKKEVHIPVICAGRMENPELAAEAVASGKIDAVGIARQLLADPDYPQKVQRGSLESIRPCIACHNGCLGSLLTGNGVTCALRPATMHEQEYRLEPAKEKKRIMIIGGGIGGMETARLTSMRGHDVALYEKSGKLGGAFIAAAAPSFKEADKRLISWYEREMERLKVTIYKNRAAGKAVIEEEQPDVLILACGAKPKKLPIEGIEKPHVTEVKELLLSGCRLKGNTVIVGGGLSGCEAAYELALNGGHVTVLEAMDEFLNAPTLSMANSAMLKDLLVFHNVQVLTSAKLKRILDREVEAETPEGMKTLKADNVVMAAGYTPDNPFAGVDSVKEIYTVGDADKVGNLMDVIKTAYDTALKI